MALAADEFDAILKFDARRLAAMAMSAYGRSSRVRRALCMQHCSHPLFHLTLLARVHRRLHGAHSLVGRRSVIPGPVQVRRIPPPTPEPQRVPPIANSSGRPSI